VAQPNKAKKGGGKVAKKIKVKVTIEKKPPKVKVPTIKNIKPFIVLPSSP